MAYRATWWARRLGWGGGARRRLSVYLPSEGPEEAAEIYKHSCRTHLLLDTLFGF